MGGKRAMGKLARRLAGAGRAIAGAVLLSGIAAVQDARAQVVYPDCAAFDGHVFQRESPDPFTSQTVTVARVLDGDAFSFAISTLSGAIGTYSAAIQADGADIFRETFSGVGTATRSAAYDPPTDATNVVFAFDTLPFTSPEAFVRIAVSCVPGTPPGSTAPPSGQAPGLFLQQRAQRLLDARPDRPRYVRKRLAALWGDSTQGGVAAGAEDPVLAGMNARDETLRLYAYTNGAAAPACDGLCPDVWTEAHYTRFTGTGGRSGELAVGYAGVDFLVHPAVVMGLLGQLDWMREDVSHLGTRTESTGWMAGPYLSMRLTPDLYLDMRGAAGRSTATVKTLASLADFDTTRWLVHAQLTGNFRRGPLRLSPEVSVDYYSEKARDLTAATPFSLDDDPASLGRVRFGPEIARLFDAGGGIALEPHVSFAGVWDFHRGDPEQAGGVTYDAQALRGLIEAGLLVHGLDGVNVRLAGKYDGIGVAGVEAYGGQFWISVPLR